jgi:hypothetical protein
VSDTDHRSPLTLEDLLRLKRAERPSPEFWVRFESELRQKQLAALLERRSWWHTMPQFLSQRRAFMPLGASALLALTLVSIKIYSAGQLPRLEALNTVASASPLQAITTPVDFAVHDQAAALPSHAYAAETDSDGNAAVVAAVPLSDHLPENAAELTPWSAPLSVQSPSAKLFASHNEPVEMVEPRLAQALSPNPVPVTSNRFQGGARAELASVSAMTSKRTRLLAQFSDRQFTPDPQAPANIRERLTRRLAATDTSLNDHFTRVGFKGDQVSLRF